MLEDVTPPTQPDGFLAPPPRWPPTAIAAATPEPEPDDEHRFAGERSHRMREAILHGLGRFGRKLSRMSRPRLRRRARRGA
jgi:hypothetical protein